MLENTVHELKVWPEYFKNLWQGRKTAELRFDDRNYMIGDLLILKEWMPKKKIFTGRIIPVVVTDITRLASWIENVDPLWVILHFNQFDELAVRAKIEIMKKTGYMGCGNVN